MEREQKMGRERKYRNGKSKEREDEERMKKRTRDRGTYRERERERYVSKERANSSNHQNGVILRNGIIEVMSVHTPRHCSEIALKFKPVKSKMMSSSQSQT